MLRHTNEHSTISTSLYLYRKRTTNSPSRAAPRSGVLFSGPAHAEFRFWYLKFPPPKSLLGRPIPHGASVRKGAQRGKTLWRLVGPRAQ